MSVLYRKFDATLLALMAIAVFAVAYLFSSQSPAQPTRPGVPEVADQLAAYKLKVQGLTSELRDERQLRQRLQRELHDATRQIDDLAGRLALARESAARAGREQSVQSVVRPVVRPGHRTGLEAGGRVVFRPENTSAGELQTRVRYAMHPSGVEATVPVLVTKRPRPAAQVMSPYAPRRAVNSASRKKAARLRQDFTARRKAMLRQKHLRRLAWEARSKQRISAAIAAPAKVAVDRRPAVLPGRIGLLGRPAPALPQRKIASLGGGVEKPPVRGRRITKRSRAAQVRDRRRARARQRANRARHARFRPPHNLGRRANSVRRYRSRRKIEGYSPALYRQLAKSAFFGMTQQ
ncbi:MAG TPA: hypothetical protein VMX97_03770 [Hyphomicrobiaceae bacterium]|nr:hypothetical protein [Hyphomicrobiaceae bacterium]